MRIIIDLLTTRPGLAASSPTSCASTRSSRSSSIRRPMWLPLRSSSASLGRPARFFVSRGKIQVYIGHYLFYKNIGY